jgi:hypothetical protein
MTDEKRLGHEMSHRGYARIAGVSYAVIIIAGIFAEFFVRGRLIVADNAAATAANIMAAEILFRLGFTADLVMILCDVVVAWALFGLFAKVSRSLAGLAAAFRLVHAAVLGANLLHHFAALLVLSPVEGATGAIAAGAPSLALLAIEAHGYGYLIAQVFFAVHCLLIGFLLLRSRTAPRVLGILLGLAGIGYVVESGTLFLAPRLDAATEPGLVVAGIAEISFAIWLGYIGTRRSHAGLLEEKAK